MFEVRAQQRVVKIIARFVLCSSKLLNMETLSTKYFFLNRLNRSSGGDKLRNVVMIPEWLIGARAFFPIIPYKYAVNIFCLL